MEGGGGSDNGSESIGSGGALGAVVEVEVGLDIVARSVANLVRSMAPSESAGFAALFFFLPFFAFFDFFFFFSSSEEDDESEDSSSSCSSDDDVSEGPPGIASSGVVLCS